LEKLWKVNKAGYTRQLNYLDNRDLKNIAYRVRQDGDQWALDDPRGKEVAKYETEDLAIYHMIDRECQDYAALPGVTEQEVEALRGVRLMTTAAFDRFIAPSREILRKAIEAAEKKGYSVHKQDQQWVVLNKDGSKHGKGFESEADAWASVIETPQIISYDKDGKKIKIDWHVALAAMGDLRGSYMPRSRKPGRLVLKAWKKGEDPIREHFDLGFLDSSSKIKNLINSKLAIGNRARALKKKGYKVSIDRVEHMPEDVFDLVAPTFGALEIYNKAMEDVVKPETIAKMGINGRMDGKDYVVDADSLKPEQEQILKDLGGEYHYTVKKTARSTVAGPKYVFKDANANIESKIAQALTQAAAMMPDFDAQMATIMAERISNIFKARGPRSHMISRSKGGDVWQGYERDTIERLRPYLRGIASGEAKKELATNLFKTMTGNDISWKECKDSHKGKATRDE
jgi:hypothetical protein